MTAMIKKTISTLAFGLALRGCAGMLLLAVVAAPCWAASRHNEPFRPQFHFTPATNWMNDPNGMVYYDGEYHLFYQFNPFGDKWGHMSWGHAVTRDLVHWEHLPVALYEENDVMIFSGSAVVDWKNTSGFGKDGQPPLIAIYTGHYTKKPLQNQHIAYSNDRGRTWTKHASNPVLDIGERDFRDPKVMWHEPTKRWVMTVAWPAHHKVRFYASSNLKDWTHLSDFGPAGGTGGIWECPDLFPLAVEGRKEQKWVLIVNLNPGGPAGGSACQYFVGHFDGKEFTLDSASPVAQAPTTQAPLWADYGADFYAAVSWSDVPRRDGRRLWLGWMSDWRYANDVPTSPWRNAMSVPRELTLRNTPEGLRLVQEPVRDLKKLRGKRHRIARASFSEASEWLAKQKFASNLLDVEAEFDLGNNTGDFGIKIASGPGEETVVHCSAEGRWSVDRARSGKTDFHPKFAATYQSTPRSRPDSIKLRLLLDSSSLEVFAYDGEVVLTSLIFPRNTERRLETFASGTPPRVQRLTIWELDSAWR
jgi:fructan beta-fructosidase